MPLDRLARERKRACAISGLLAPPATSAAISCSRSLKAVTPPARLRRHVRTPRRRRRASATPLAVRAPQASARDATASSSSSAARDRRPPAPALGRAAARGHPGSARGRCASSTTRSSSAQRPPATSPACNEISPHDSPERTGPVRVPSASATSIRFSQGRTCVAERVDTGEQLRARRASTRPNSAGSRPLPRRPEPASNGRGFGRARVSA